jgi:hypothetical protein
MNGSPKPVIQYRLAEQNCLGNTLPQSAFGATTTYSEYALSLATTSNRFGQARSLGAVFVCP